MRSTDLVPSFRNAPVERSASASGTVRVSVPARWRETPTSRPLAYSETARRREEHSARLVGDGRRPSPHAERRRDVDVRLVGPRREHLEEGAGFVSYRPVQWAPVSATTERTAYRRGPHVRGPGARRGGHPAGRPRATGGRDVAADIGPRGPISRRLRGSSRRASASRAVAAGRPRCR